MHYVHQSQKDMLHDKPSSLIRTAQSSFTDSVLFANKENINTERKVKQNFYHDALNIHLTVYFSPDKMGETLRGVRNHRKYAIGTVNDGMYVYS